MSRFANRTELVLRNWFSPTEPKTAALLEPRAEGGQPCLPSSSPDHAGLAPYSVVFSYKSCGYTTFLNPLDRGSKTRPRQRSATFREYEPAKTADQENPAAQSRPQQTHPSTIQTASGGYHSLARTLEERCQRHIL